MYPRHYFSLFPPFPREDKVFVAMSFDEKFDSRWKDVISPGIRSVRGNGVALEPYRVDSNQISDSILTEILDGVARSRLVLADVTTLLSSNCDTVRNGNVMYEVGLAHAVRLPEEVLLFRSDSDPIMFDIANVRVNWYDPENNRESARSQVSNAIVGSLKEIDLKRHLAVRRASESLDLTSWLVLLEAAEDGIIRHSDTRTLGQAIGNRPRNDAIARLLDVGALATDYQALASPLIKESMIKEYKGDKHAGRHLIRQVIGYTLTPFGGALISFVTRRMTKDGNPGIVKALSSALKELESENPTLSTSIEP